MRIRVTETDRGFSLAIDGPAWQAPPCQIRFPPQVWQAFPAKELLTNELAYALTMVPPLLVDHPTVWYDTPEPQCFDFFNDCFERAIPNLVEPISRESSEEILARFRKVGRHFPAPPTEATLPERSDWQPRRVVLPFSFGKDSLLTMATLQELGYEVIPVLIDERMLPRGQALREPLCHRLAEEFGTDCQLVTNEIQLLSDYQVLERPQTRLHQVHIYFVYLLAMLPFCDHFRAPLIACNNEFHHSLDFLHREGFLAPRKVMQSRAMTGELGEMVATLSGGQIRACNLLGGLGDFAIHRLLHTEFPAHGALRISCHLEMSDQPRWCHQCPRCAHAFLFFLAGGEDPFAHGFSHSMLTADHKDLFYLFSEHPHPEDQFRRFSRDEEALAFAMAAAKGADGDLIEAFLTMTPLTPEEAKRLQRRILAFQDGTTPELAVEQEAANRYRGWLAAYTQQPPS